MCDKPISLRERKKARTRQALVAAALRLFAERGFEATTVADIAEAADVSPRTFFTYFPAKEDVLFAGAKDRIERLRDALAKRAPDESFLDALRRAARDILADRTFQAEAQRTHMQVIGANPALGARALQDLLAAEQVVAAAIAADLGVDQTDLQPQVAAAAAVNALRGALMTWFLSGASGDPQPAFDQALNLLEHGLGTLSAAASSHHPPSSAAQARWGDAGPADEAGHPSPR
jgi:AcrR family transcriptional regulator